METYLTMEEFWELIDPVEAAPTSTANLKCNQKAYTHIWFLVEPNCRDSIVDIKSGRDAWAALKAEHEKDTPSTRMNLRQRFYALSHDPVVGVMPFVNDVLTVVHQLESINRKPTKDEITDKLLIGLHSSFAAVRTNLSLRTPEPSIKEITAALKEFEDNETLRPSFSAPIDSVIKEESLLYAQKGGRHGSGGGGSRPKFDDFDWGNSKGRDGVCFRCGRTGHVAGKCVADMPADVKECIFNHQAHISTADNADIHALPCSYLKTDSINDISLEHLTANDPLVLALSQDHTHTAVDPSGWCIFGPDKDVPPEFQTADGYVSDEQD